MQAIMTRLQPSRPLPGCMIMAAHDSTVVAGAILASACAPLIATEQPSENSKEGIVRVSARRKKANKKWLRN
jgi:hypothetical protein